MYIIIRIMLSCYQSLDLQQKQKINSLERTGEEDESTKRIKIERQRMVDGEIGRGRDGEKWRRPGWGLGFEEAQIERGREFSELH
jgi:hypothetical protein